MKPLVSFLLPTFRRPNACRRSIESVLQHAGNEIEIVVAVNKDDALSLEAKFHLYPCVNQIAVEGVSKTRSLIEIYRDLIQVSQGHWLWIWNDDAYMRGQSDWLGEIRTTPLHGWTIQGQGDVDLCFPCVPHNCWQELGADCPGQPIDHWFKVVLEENHGWKRKVVTTEIIHQWRQEI